MFDFIFSGDVKAILGMIAGIIALLSIKYGEGGTGKKPIFKEN